MQSKRSLLTSACLVFFSLGIMTAAIGPVLPELAGQTGSDLAAIGSVFTGIFLGALLAQLVSGPFGDRVGMNRVLVGGVTGLAAGTLGITLSHSLLLTFALAFFAGLGHGAVDLGANVMIASVFEKKSVSAVNLLNVFFGLGAFAGPAAASFALRAWGTGLPVLWASSLILLVMLPFLLKIKLRPAQQPSLSSGSEPGSIQRLYRSPLLWALGLLILLYVGTENGIGGWITAYTESTTAMSIDQAALVAAGFWLALTAGRIVTVVLGLKISSYQLLFFSLLGASAGSMLLLAGSGQSSLTVAAVLLIGFSFGSIYPTTMAIITGVFYQGPGKAASVVAAMGSIGGMALPWTQGILLAGSGPLASAWFTAVATLLMLGLILAIYIVSLRERKAQVGEILKG